MYNDPIIEKYIELIKEKAGVFKVYYQGEPTRIPTVNLPCLIISKTGTTAGVHTNSEDQHLVSLSLTVVTDIRQELSTSENDETVIAGIARLYQIMEGRNADYTLKPDSILDILRSNIAIAGGNLRTQLGDSIAIDYGETLQNREPAEWRIQAKINLVAFFDQVR
jgi:hypothetical protein